TGALFDLFGAKKTTVLSLVLLILTLVGLTYAKYPAAIAVMLLASGIGNCYATVGLPVLSRAVYGNREYASFTGLFSTLGNVGSTVAPALMGVLRDAAASYAPGYWMCVGLLAVSGIGVILCIPKRSFEK
ncbi:MAG: MFS transporter, partial [Clostridia bacterium]|nr:MFS transporter [Clostridia bacterium]